MNEKTRFEAKLTTPIVEQSREIQDLESKDTLELVERLHCIKILTFMIAFCCKSHHDGCIHNLKARCNTRQASLSYS